MKLLLLGATGYLGNNIALHLSNLGHTVYCVVRPMSNIRRLKDLDNDRVDFVNNNLDSVELLLKHKNIDAIINAVCQYKPNADLYANMLEANMIFPLNILNLAIKHEIKYFLTMGTSLPENLNIYSFSKNKLSEFGCFLSKKNNISFYDFKLEMFYGGVGEPEDRFMKNCMTKLIKNEDLALTSGVQKRNIINVEDVINIIGKFLEGPMPLGYRVLPLGTGEQHSIKEIVCYMKNYVASKSRLLFGAIPDRINEPNTIANIDWMKEMGIQVRYKFFEGIESELRKTMLKYLA